LIYSYPNQVQSNAEFESNQVQQPSWHNPAPVNQEISSWDTSGTSSYTNLQHQQQPSGTESYSNLQQLIPKEEDRNPEIFKPQQNLYGDPTVGKIITASVFVLQLEVLSALMVTELLF